tara:strand:- start:2305 stop:2793 length:489 start_codon:yes stop_codon:yes gene_type:complete
MSDALKKALALFFKYFENDDQEMLLLYYKLLSKEDVSFVEDRLMEMITLRDKSFKTPAVSEILSPLRNARKEHVWKLLNDHLKNPHNPMPDHVFALKRFLDVPVNRTEFSMRKIKDEFFGHKYDEFRAFLEGRIKIPSLIKELRRYDISLTEELKQLEASSE